MFLFKLLLRNAFRQKLRIGLTMLGLVVAICAFGLLRTIVSAWYAGVDNTSSSRIISRNAISLTFPLPLYYKDRLRAVDGITAVSYANWFGGVYITERNFFPQFAIDAESYLPLYPEFVIAPDQRKAFITDRQGAIVGRKIADQFGWKVGDTLSLRGTIYPGTWNFNIRAIYDGIDSKTDTSQMFFHWARLNESVKKSFGASRANQVGVYIMTVREPDAAAQVSTMVDAQFKNSNAETLTETEKAFQLGFVSMTESILLAVQAVSFVVILIIMAVMANTIAMTARERISEYATLQALGFAPSFISFLIIGESLIIALVGGALGVALTFPLAAAFVKAVGTLFPIFYVSQETVQLQMLAALVVGIVAAAIPAWRMSHIKIVDGLRHLA